MNTVEKRKKTMKERHGIECPLVSPGVREKTLARIKEAASKMLPTGESLSAFCDRNNFKRRWGRIILEKYGMAALINFVTLQQKKITSCEIKFIELMKEFGDLEVLHRNPKELLTTRKADFCLDINKKRLFVITENLWDGNQGRGIFSNIRQSFEKTNNAVMMFYSNEVFDRPKVVKSLVKEHFKLNQKIRAEEMEIRKVAVQVGEWFFGEHTLTPFCPKYLTYYGFIHKGRIMACFGVRKRNGGDLHIDLFGYSSGFYVTQCVKFMTSFLHKKYNPLKIIKYSNMRVEGFGDFLSDGYVTEGERITAYWSNGDAILNKREVDAFKVYDMGQTKLVKTFVK